MDNNLAPCSRARPCNRSGFSESRPGLHIRSHQGRPPRRSRIHRDPMLRHILRIRHAPMRQGMFVRTLHSRRPVPGLKASVRQRYRNSISRFSLISRPTRRHRRHRHNCHHHRRSPCALRDRGYTREQLLRSHRSVSEPKVRYPHVPCLPDRIYPFPALLRQAMKPGF